MATLERIRVHPVKSLDAVRLNVATIREHGGLSWDRRFAIIKADDSDDPAYVNGKNERQIHRLRADFDLEVETITIGEYTAADRETFHLVDDRAALEAWLGDYVGYPVSLIENDRGGFPDDTDAAGPTLISQATIEAVADWFPEIDAEEMCRRLRPNLIVDGVPAFWEDRLYESPETVVSFQIGDATLHGVNPCQRCVVPTRHPDTGTETDGFRETFVERREATLPAWASEDWFDHYFRLMVNTRVPESTVGSDLTVGDRLDLGEVVDA